MIGKGEAQELLKKEKISIQSFACAISFFGK